MRSPAKLLLTGAVLLVTASCYGDGSVAPSVGPSVNGNPALQALVVAQSTDLVIPAAGGDINVFGVYTLSFPANAVCDPNAADTQAGYANHAWDAPCTQASGDVAIRATAKWSNGRLYVDFQPALRFVPSAIVTLSTDVFAPTVKFLDANGVTGGLPFYYTSGIDAPGVADALSDASLRTVVNSSGRIQRRIKHFSGYFIAYQGEFIPCDPAAGNPMCVWVDDNQFGGP
jgi:hypothetical protein